MDDRIIRRLVYDGNYERAINLLLDIVMKQQEKIKELEQKLCKD